MSLTPEEAAKSLREITDTQSRARESLQYSRSSPYFFLWGLVWVLGYGAAALLPFGISNLVWMALIILALMGHTAIGTLSGQKYQNRDWRVGVMFGVLFAFAMANMFVMRPTPLAAAAFWPIFMAAAYICAGLWLGTRFIVAGVVVGGAALAGFAFIPEYFNAWMAVFGGGTLLLTGFWMRRI